MWPFKPKSPWNYLGHSKISYHKHGEPDVIEKEYILHYWARSNNLDKRKCTFADHYYNASVEGHTWYQSYVIPWLNGENFRDYILDYTARKTQI